MTLAEARDIVWSRLAITARNDGRNVDFYEDGYSESDVRRLERAHEQVAETIERRLAKRPPVKAPPKRSEEPMNVVKEENDDE